VILDTNALSAVADGSQAVVEQIAPTRTRAVPVIVMGEYRFGFMQPRRKADYERWLAKSLSSCRVLDVGAETAMRYPELQGELKIAGTPIPANDAWIAALCRQHSLSILSQD
jgi:tRNA(fMet)-specific endonuclease VapC